MRTFVIYKAINNINGKVYIGKTSNFKERKWQHERCYKKEDCKFHRALQKYGKDNFSWEIIDKAKNLDEAYSLEKLYIELHNSYGPAGYNMTKGGAGGSMWNAIPVVCLSTNGDFMKKYDSATAAKKDGFSVSCVLNSCRDFHVIHKNHIFMFYDEYKTNGSRKYVKPKSNCTKAIIQCNLNGEFISEFKSVQEASMKTGANRTTISGVLTHNYKTANGFIFVYKDEFPIKDINLYRKKEKGRKIAQIDINTGETIRIYDKIKEAGTALGVNYKSIHKVIDKPNRTAYGFKWISQ